MLEDLDNLASRIQQLVQLAASAKAENHAIAEHARAERLALVERIEAEKRAFTEHAEADYRARTQRLESEHGLLTESLARCEAENQQLRSMLATARDRVDSVLARIPDPDAIGRHEEPEQTSNGTA